MGGEGEKNLNITPFAVGGKEEICFPMQYPYFPFSSFEPINERQMHFLDIGRAESLQKSRRQWESPSCFWPSQTINNAQSVSLIISAGRACFSIIKLNCSKSVVASQQITKGFVENLSNIAGYASSRLLHGFDG